MSSIEEERSLLELLDANPSVEEVQALLDKYPDALKEKYGGGSLPLHIAVKKEGMPIEVTKLLIDKHPDAVMERNENGDLPLHLALRNGASVEVIQLLIKENPGAAKLKAVYFKRLPLHFAARFDASVEVMQLLIKVYPDALQEKDEQGKLPLHIAARSSKSVEVIELLANEYPDALKEKNKMGWLPLHIAVGRGVSKEVIQLFIKKYPDAMKKKNVDGCLPLHVCRKDELIQTLLDDHPDAASVRNPKTNHLPLHDSMYNVVSEETTMSLLNAYPQAANEPMDDGKHPVEFFLQNEASEDLMLALYKIVPKTRLDGLLPLGIFLANGSSDDAILSVLKAYPVAARETFSTKCDIRLLPLHVAMEKNSSGKVRAALIDAYPNAAEEGKNPFENILKLHKFLEDMEMNGGDSIRDVLQVIKEYPDAAKTRGMNGYLPLHVAIHRDAPAGVLHHIFRAYPQAVKRKIQMKDGRLPIEVLAENTFLNHGLLTQQAFFLRHVVTQMLKYDMPVSIEDGSPVEHNGSWHACVSSNNELMTIAVSGVLADGKLAEGRVGSGFGKHVHGLVDARDAKGRTALGIAAELPRAEIYKYLLFCSRYKLQIGPPVYRTNTSVVLRAQDLDEQADYGVIFDIADKDKNGKLDRNEVKAIAGSIGLTPDLFLKGSGTNTISRDEFIVTCKRQLGDGPREVVIKLMQSKDHWERECNARNNKNYTLDPKFVVSALSNIPTQTDIEEAVERGDGGLGSIVEKYLDGNKPGKYALVMDAADRNGQQILFQEQPKLDAIRNMLRQVFEAVQHIHEKKLMHGDLKLVNIMRSRIDNKLRLIDLDASARILQEGEAKKSFAGAKFSSAILPPEMIDRIEGKEKLEEFNKYWKVENGKDPDEKVAPMPYEERGKVKAYYVVKSFRTEGGMPVSEGLPYDLEHASESIDAWSLGVLAFTLLTGETLIPSNRDDDCASGDAMHLLYSWGTRPEVLKKLFKKIHDDAARDLVMKLLQFKSEDRPSITNLLGSHPFFHTKIFGESKKLMEKIENMNVYLVDAANDRKDDRALLERMNANILVIKQLSYDGKAELARTRHVLMKGIFEATEIDTPATFIVAKEKIPELSNEEARQKILDIVTAEDGGGVSMNTKYASVTLSAEGAEFDLEGDLKEHYEQVKTGLNWAKRIKDIGLRVAAGEVGKAFDIIKDGISDLTVGNEMYLYLIDELTGEPVQADGWPLVITTPSELVPRLLPLMQVGMRAMCIYNGTVGLARMFGFLLPKVPEGVSKGAQESVELLKKESSVEEFGVVHEEVKGCTEEKKSVRGASLRDFVNFMKKNDPGLKEGKSGDFAGLQRIGDPEDGTALWTTLIDRDHIEDALKKRAKQREEELLKHNEHIKKMAEKKVIELDEGTPEPSTTAAANDIEHVQKTARKEIESERSGKEVMSEEDETFPAGTTNSSNEWTRRSMTKDVLTPDEMGGSNPVVHSDEIAELIKAAREATASANIASASANQASASAIKATAAAERAANACCTIL